MTTLEVGELFERHAEFLKLHWLAGQAGSRRTISLSPDDQPPACAAIGYLNLIHPHRIQVIGEREMLYLTRLARPLYQGALQQLFEHGQPACIIVADGARPSLDFQQRAEATETPLFCSALSAQRVLGYLHDAFLELLTQRVTLHGVFMDVLGTGVLIMGESGTGKSELALELVSRGHRLVADDAPEFTKLTPTVVDGTCPLGMTAFLEVRGLGIVNVQTLFGDSAVKNSKYLRLIVQLVAVSAEEPQSMDRLQGDYSSRLVLGVEIPQLRLPVAAGRNLAVLLECAVRNHNLKRRGYNAAEEFAKRQREALERGQF